MLINTEQIRSITLDQIKIYDSKSLVSGGSIYLSSRFNGNLIINDGTFSEIHAYKEGAFIYSESTHLKL